MSFNLNIIAYIIVYIMSILFFLFIFLKSNIKMKSDFFEIHSNSVNSLDKKLNEFSQKSQDFVIQELIKTKKEFENTQKLQENMLDELRKFNQFLNSSICKIDSLNNLVNQREELEAQIIKLKKIIKRREKNV
ncbi:MAG: hypothetical protein WC141_10565 [Arcobacteraceae bacterium]